MAKNKDFKEDPEIQVEPGYLTLKEASLISNYSPDYIGQLIREKKIEGKQVFSSVAWVTNEESLRLYMTKKGKTPVPISSHPSDMAHVPDFFRPLLYTIIAGSIFFLLILFHVFSVTIDRALFSSLEEETVSRVQSP